MASRQITQNEFFNSLSLRHQDYAVALTNGSDALAQHMLKLSSDFISETKQQDKQFSVFGPGYWGYGLNYIDDSVTKYANPDLSVIQKSPELNKHQTFNTFHLMIFRVEDSELIYTVFSTDLCSGKTDKHVNKRKRLDTLTSVIVNQRDSVNTLKLCFGDGSKFTFETDFKYKVWDYAPDYKAVFDDIITKNKKEAGM